MESECAICLNEIIAEHKCKTNCNHEFCEPCLDEWFSLGKTECPMCRSSINQLYVRNETHRIVKVYHTPPLQPQLQLFGNIRFEPLFCKLASFGGIVLGCGMLYFGYYVWDTYETLSDTRLELMVCEEQLKHASQLLKTYT